MKNADLVVPAWMAGIQVRTNASGDIHVSLDSSTPCWNDANREGHDIFTVNPEYPKI